MKRLIPLLLLFILFISCDVFSPPAGDAFGIYMLKDKSVTIYNDPGDALLSKALDSIPVLTSKDIDFYDWSSHCIYLKTDKESIKERLLSSSGILFAYPGAPFIVTCGDQAKYYGYFYSLIMSIAPFKPYVDEMSLTYYPNDILPINASWNSDETDDRDNENVKEALQNAGLFHAGIEIEADSNVTFYAIDDTSMGVEYSFTIINRDQDALYILDPDKMDYHSYFYFNVQPSFRNVDTGNLIRWKNPSGSYDTFVVEPNDNLNWYTLLAPGGSMTRTIRSGNYPVFPAGDYEFIVRYHSPITSLDKSTRTKILGRIWIGGVESPLFTVTYSP